MKGKKKNKIQLVIDPLLISKDQSDLITRVLTEENIKFLTSFQEIEKASPVIFFIEKKNIKKIKYVKNKIIVIPHSEIKHDDLYSSLNTNSYEEILIFLRRVFFNEKKMEIKEKIKESEFLIEVMKKNTEEDKCIEEERQEKLTKSFEHLVDLELQLLREESIDKWNVCLKNVTKKITEVQILMLVETEKLFDLDFPLDENTLIVKLPHENYCLFFKIKNLDVKKDADFVMLLISTLNRSLQVVDQKLVRSDGEVEFWKKVFSKIPYPMAAITNIGDLLIYNESFAKIGILPKECLRFKDLETIEIFQSFYKIRKINFIINLMEISYFVFYMIEEKQLLLDNAPPPKNKNKSSTDELGIISSSIAHELNNPLAGILAALSLLELETNWSIDAKTDMEDMKNGARRCKELVEIFLGFSKFSPVVHSKISIKESLDQAINLLRFRMIESNLRLEMKYVSTLQNFSYQINSSIMSMILYLICSELMTAYAHHRLLTQTSQGYLSGEVIDFSNQIILKLEQNFEYENKIAQSKLIQHLLIFERLEVRFLKQEIRLTYRV